MRLVVRPDALEAAAARARADAACLEVLTVVARLEAAAEAVAGTELAVAALVTADRLRVVLFGLRLQMRVYAGHLADAAQHYQQTDATAVGAAGPTQ